MPRLPAWRSTTPATTERATEALGFAPALRMTGLLDPAVSAEQAEQLMSVLGEALSDAARNAHAPSVDVSVESTDTALRLRVADSGRGIDPAVTRRAAWPTSASARRRWCVRPVLGPTERRGRRLGRSAQSNTLMSAADD
ncbi:ATP-binding protein [Streptomyces sp. NPDC048710]|uniref:ATP-binding protein n=1 Tax=Streptomyces sp. NPDC048710 TaxID=3365586 RepID=UPI003722F994